LAIVLVVRDRAYRLIGDYERDVADYVRSLDPYTTEAEALLAAAAIFGAFMKIPDIMIRGLEPAPDAVLARACEILENGVR